MAIVVKCSVCGKVLESTDEVKPSFFRPNSGIIGVKPCGCDVSKVESEKKDLTVALHHSGIEVDSLRIDAAQALESAKVDRKLRVEAEQSAERITVMLEEYKGIVADQGNEIQTKTRDLAAHETTIINQRQTINDLTNQVNDLARQKQIIQDDATRLNLQMQQYYTEKQNLQQQIATLLANKASTQVASATACSGPIDVQPVPVIPVPKPEPTAEDLFSIDSRKASDDEYEPVD